MHLGISNLVKPVHLKFRIKTSRPATHPPAQPTHTQKPQSNLRVNQHSILKQGEQQPSTTPRRAQIFSRKLRGIFGLDTCCLMRNITLLVLPY